MKFVSEYLKKSSIQTDLLDTTNKIENIEKLLNSLKDERLKLFQKQKEESIKIETIINTVKDQSKKKDMLDDMFIEQATTRNRIGYVSDKLDSLPEELNKLLKLQRKLIKEIKS